MAERSYFSLRLAIPGYTFLLLFISINFRVVLFSLQTIYKIPEFLELFYALLLALSGSAFGFLISQTWFWWCRWRDILYEAPKSEIATFSKHYNLVTNPTKQQKKMIVLAFSYVQNIMSKKYKSLDDYLNRRFDLFNTFGATMHSIFWGLSLGWAVRLIAWHFLKKPFDFPLILSYKLLGYTEFWVLVLTTLFGSVLFCLLWRRRDHVMEQYDLMAKVVIEMAYKNEIVEPEELKRVFPSNIFKK